MSLRSRKKTGDLIGIIIIVACLILITAVGSFMFLNDSKQIKVDKNTFCPKIDSKNKERIENYGKVVALIDLTDPLNQAQKEFFIKEIENIKKKIPRYHNLTIYTVDQSLNLDLNKKLSKCNPGTLDDIKNTFEAYSENPQKIKNNWNKGFSREISNVIENIILKNNSQSKSPVMEMFQLIAIREFKDFKGNGNKIIILSDMIQNTSEFSMYSSGIPKFVDFFKTEYFSKIKTNLSENVDVQLMIIKRDGFRKKQETNNFVQFWAQFFMNGNKANDFVYKFIDG